MAQTVDIPAGQSIQAAIDSAPAGSVFQLASGMWREQEFLARSGDTFIGDPQGGTVLSGARVLDQWQRDGQRWRSAGGLPPPLIDSQPVFEGSLANNQNDLWLNDALLGRVDSLDKVEAGTWFFDPADNAVVMGNDPSGKLVEYSVVANQTWDNGATNCLWRNITVEKYATSAQQGAHHGMRGWLYEHCTFKWMHGAGINIGANTIVSGGRYIDNGQCGIEGYQCDNARIEDVEMARNGFCGYNTDWDGGGTKLCTCDGVVVSGCHVHHNKDQGIWFDIDCTNCLIEGNTCEDNTGVGIMYEISYAGSRIIGNHCARNGGIGGYGAGGIYISNSQGVEVASNTVEVKTGNTAIGGGISVINDGRGSGAQGIYESRDLNIHHNTITHTDDSAQNGYWVYQSISSPAVVFDHNTYIVKDPSFRHWRVADRDVTWDELRAAGQEANGTLQRLGDAPVDPPPDTGDGDIPTLAPGTYKILPGTTLIV